MRRINIIITLFICAPLLVSCKKSDDITLSRYDTPFIGSSLTGTDEDIIDIDLHSGAVYYTLGGGIYKTDIATVVLDGKQKFAEQERRNESDAAVL